MSSREFDPAAPAHVRRAWRALMSLPVRRALPSRAPKSADAMTELVFDHAPRFDTTRILYLLTDLQIRRLDRLARDHCESLALLLDPRALAEEALCVLFQDSLDGRRVRPIRKWAETAIARAANDAISRPELAPPRGRRASARADERLRALAGVANRQDDATRRIAWHHAVAGRSARWIARHLELPFERVEFVLTQLSDAAERQIDAGRMLAARRGDGAGRHEAD